MNESQSRFTLITGASSGIGRATAVRLSGERALILHGRDIARLEQTRGLCAQAGRHVLWPFDLSNTSGISDSLANLISISGGGGVEVFVHCAGTVGLLPMRSTDFMAMQAVMNVNFLSAASIVHLLLKKKINAGGSLANIVFISSIFSSFGARGHAAYCASKAALDGLMRALAVELAPAIRVNSILPGAVPSPMAAEAFSDPSIAAKLQKDYPLGTGQTADIAGAVEFLLSSNSRWMTGQQLTVDGGRTANMSMT